MSRTRQGAAFSVSLNLVATPIPAARNARRIRKTSEKGGEAPDRKDQLIADINSEVTSRLRDLRGALAIWRPVGARVVRRFVDILRQRRTERCGRGFDSIRHRIVTGVATGNAATDATAVCSAR